MRFSFPIAKLPEDEHERYEYLHTYFDDQRARSFKENGQWIVEPYWPDTADYFADPNILKGLKWWDKNIPLTEIHHQIRREHGIQFSLNDSWTLYSWSIWLSQQHVVPPEVIILHLDFHNDLMSPRIGTAKKGSIVWQDLLTGQLVDIKRPETIKSAILSGAIGVGSFIVPFLYVVPKVHFYHLQEKPINEEKKKINCLKKDWKSDTLLDPHKYRPSVIFNHNSSNCLLSYTTTNDIEEIISALPPVPILLHIDMDYFNCRYDGDTGWRNHLPRFDPNIDEIVNRINIVCGQINKVKSQIHDITVALSPGFYPTEFWELSIEVIKKLLAK